MNNSRESLISAPRTHVGDRTCRKTDMEWRSLEKAGGGLQFSAPTRTQGHAYRCLSPRKKSARNQVHVIGNGRFVKNV